MGAARRAASRGAGPRLGWQILASGHSLRTSHARDLPRVCRARLRKDRVLAVCSCARRATNAPIGCHAHRHDGRTGSQVVQAILDARRGVWRSHRGERSPRSRARNRRGSLTSGEQWRLLRYETSTGEEHEHAMWWAVSHFFNHQTHHRGQVTT
ncbi:MAG: hypothetical protein HKN10_13190, partial [Myxococcales bacterium]|nr:hypothetical protein [Myxococcales bacterium]